jgi:hypothetical protein
MAWSSLVYFCVDNQPKEWRTSSWFIKSRKALAFCPFLKSWDKCFCVINEANAELIALKSERDETKRQRISHLTDKDENELDDEYIEKFFDENCDIDSAINYKYSINLWELKEISVSRYDWAYAKFVDIRWHKRILDLWAWDWGEVEKYGSEFLLNLLSCDKIWNIRIMFWKKANAVLPWMSYKYYVHNTNEGTIERKEPDIDPECWPCDELIMYNDWKIVKKLPQEEFRNLNRRGKIYELENRGIKVTFPHDWIILD